MMGNKYSIDISLLDTIFEILENKELVDEIKINLSYKKEKDQIKDKLLLYKLISDNRDIIELYIEKKFILSNLKNSIKDIRRKLELVRERESRLSGRIINYFSNDDCKLKGLELSLKEAVSTCCKLEDEIKDMINNISNEKLKEIISNISFYSNDLELDENDILELEERLDEISEIECSERVRKLIDGDSDICEIVVNLSNKKQRNNKTPIISFYILKSLSDFYKNNIFTCDDKKMEDSYKDLINEINVRNEEKLKSISNIDVSINVGKYVKTKHST